MVCSNEEARKRLARRHSRNGPWTHECCFGVHVFVCWEWIEGLEWLLLLRICLSFFAGLQRPNLLPNKALKRTRACDQGYTFEIVTFCDRHTCHKWSHIECDWQKTFSCFCLEFGSERLYVGGKHQSRSIKMSQFPFFLSLLGCEHLI